MSIAIEVSRHACECAIAFKVEWKKKDYANTSIEEAQGT